jgi:hypothetical protein
MTFQASLVGALDVRVTDAFNRTQLYALPQLLYVESVSTVAEIVEAVRHLPPEQKRELLLQLEPVLLGSFEQPGDKAAKYLSDDFTGRLVAHFHRAKQAALTSCECVGRLDLARKGERQ